MLIITDVNTQTDVYYRTQTHTRKSLSHTLTHAAGKSSSRDELSGNKLMVFSFTPSQTRPCTLLCWKNLTGGLRVIDTRLATSVPTTPACESGIQLKGNTHSHVEMHGHACTRPCACMHTWSHSLQRAHDYGLAVSINGGFRELICRFIFSHVRMVKHIQKQTIAEREMSLYTWHPSGPVDTC